MSRKNKRNVPQPMAAVTQKPASLWPAFYGAFGELLGSAAVGFFFLAASLLIGKDAMVGIQIVYAATSCLLSFSFAVAGVGVKVYSAYIQMKQL
jgi:hypothetical protein